MFKTISKALLTFVFLVGLSLAAFGQSNDKQKKPPKKKDPPKIDLPKKRDTPKNNDKKKPKKPPNFETEAVLFFVRE